MALSVSTKPFYTGKLKVTPTKLPTTKLKVTTKPVKYVTPKTYNPQKTAPTSTVYFGGGSSSGGSYKIRSGDTLSAIARRYGTTVNELARLNGIKNVNLIRAGATLRLPSKGGSSSFYNPQKTASAKQLQQAKVAKDWAQKEAKRLRAEADARAKKIELKRVADAMKLELEGNKGNWWDKLTLKSDTGARNARQLATEYFQYNNDVVAPNIMARQRNFENEQGRRYQQAVDALQNATTEEEANRIIKDFSDWEKRVMDSLIAEVNSYNAEQEMLQQYAGTGINSVTGQHFGGMKKVATKVGGLGWNALKKITETPERVVNTVKNLVKPDNLRQYYDGTEIKGDLRTGDFVQNVRNAYNASSDQRIVGTSKADEAKQLAGGKGWARDSKTGEMTEFTVKPRDGFDAWRIKYGDDIANFLADPLMLLPNGWFGKGAKAIKGTKTFGKLSKAGTKFGDDFYKVARKSPILSDFLISRQAKKAGKNLKEDDFVKWLGSEKGKYGADKVDDFYNNRLPEFNKVQNKFDSSTQKNVDRMRWNQEQKKLIQPELERTLASFNKTKDFYDAGSIRRFTNMSDEMADAIYKYRSYFKYADDGSPFTTMKKPMSFDGLDNLNLTEKQRRKVIKQAHRMEETYNRLYQQARSNNVRVPFRKGYNPRYAGTERSKLNFDKDKGEFWWQKKQVDTRLPSVEDMKTGASKRLNSQIFAENPDAGRAVELVKQNKAYNEEIKRAYEKLRKGSEYKKKALNELLTPMERLTKQSFPTPPKPTKLQKFEKKLNNSTRVTYNPNKKRVFRTEPMKKTRSVDFSPMKAWTKAVLPLSPSWYVNNFGTNVPFSLSAGGAGVIPELLKLARKKGRNFDDIPDELREVLGSLSEYAGGGKLGKFASMATDDPFRIATFRALKKKGFSDKQAIKEMTDWFPNYKVKNWERPLKAISPFYKWQEHLMKLSVKMPFKRPRSAKFYSGIHDQFFRRPNEALPDYPQTYIDENGQEQTFNPKEGFEGKMYIGDDENGNPKFANTPFWAMNPSSMTDFGLNPLLSAGMDYYTGKDKWGRTNTDRSGMQLLAERFPQYNYYNAYREQGQKPTDRWFTPSGMSKWKQGHDPNLPNYDPSLDKKREYSRRRNSFWGGQIFNQTTFDKAEYDKKFRLSGFNKEFFDIDWDKRLEELQDKAGDKYYEFTDPKNPFNVLKAEKEALADKYGFDYKKDIEDGYWKKYDTKTTEETKRLKKDALDWQGEFWEDYLSRPAGSRTQASTRRPFLIDQYRKWAESDAFAENGYRRLPKFTVYKDGKATEEKQEKNLVTLKRDEAESRARRAVGRAKYQRYLEYQKAKKTGDWSFFNSGKKYVHPYQYDGKFFKSAESMQRYKDGVAKYGKSEGKSEGKSDYVHPYQYDGKFFKSQESMDRYVEGKFWADYYALDDYKDRQALLAEFPQFKQFDQPQTQEEWDQVRALLKKQRNEKLAGVDGFTASREEMKKRIESSLPSGFGGKRRLRYKF